MTQRNETALLLPRCTCGWHGVTTTSDDAAIYAIETHLSDASDPNVSENCDPWMESQDV